MSTPGKEGAIIRGAKVEGTYFCVPGERQKNAPDPTKEKNVREDAFQLGLTEGQEQGYATGKEEGYQQGFNDGIASNEKELLSSLKLLQTMVNAFKEMQENLLDHAKPELIKLCLAVCAQILKKELAHPDAFAELIEHLIAHARPITKDVPVEIKVAPDDYEMLEKNFIPLSIERQDLKQITFTVDPSLERGNCRLETSLGLINFDIARLLRDLEQKSLDVS